MSDAEPIAYTALQPGTPVQTRDGREFGRVEHMLVVDEVAVFDGLVVKTPDGTRFVDADHVGRLFTTHVLTTLSADEAAHLPLPDQDPAYDVDSNEDTGRSLGDRFGRMFGRGTWKRERR
jgi:hypothetical protein